MTAEDVLSRMGPAGTETADLLHVALTACQHNSPSNGAFSAE